jgi:methionyl-tRNA formyltransferase
MKLVFAGTPEFAVVSLKALLAAGHDIALVLTRRDRPAGRGLKPQPSAVKRFARGHDLALLQPAALEEAAVVDAIASARPGAMVVVAYGLIVPATLLRLPARGCINVHASLLPRWRGAAPIQRALLAGDEATGVTIMQMDEGLDTGPILLQEAAPIAPDETAGTLHDKLAGLGARLLLSALTSPQMPHPQEARGATYAARIGKGEAEIDWRKPAAEIERQVRAFSPAPGAQTRLDGVVLKIWRARVQGGSSDAPGTVCAVDAEGIIVACGKDALRITELQRAGGRRLPAGAFLSGSKLARGARLGARGG